MSFTDDAGNRESLTSLATQAVVSVDVEPSEEGICDRTEKVQEAILAKLSEVTDCADVTATHLGSITGTLGLRESGMSSLQEGDFDQLDSLRELYLGHNSLAELPDGIFDSLTSLQRLYLGNNELSELPDQVFDSLTNLTELGLGNNSLIELRNGVFDGLSDLEELYLGENSLSELPDGIFDNLTSLQRLYLDNNELSELPDQVFDRLTNLTELGLGNNSLSELSDGALTKLADLEELYLPENSLNQLPPGVFEGLSNLQQLHLRDNPGVPFALAADLVKVAADTMAVQVVQGAPFKMNIALSATDGTLSDTSITIPAGATRSVSVVVTASGPDPVTVSVVTAAFDGGTYQGIQTRAGESLTLGGSAATNSPATGAPAITGTVQVGETLTADTSDVSDADGLSNVSYSYQWLSSRDTEIQGATNATYTLMAADEGKTIKVRVTFTDDGGNEETLTSAPTGVVLEEPVFGDGLPGAPRNLTISAGDQELTLSWEPPDDNGNAPATRYRIEWRIDGKDYKKGHWGTSGSTTYTKTDLANGVKYVFRVKAENGNGNSYGPYGPASEEVSATPTSGSAVDLGTPVLSNTKTLHHGMVQLDWEDIEDAGWYVVQYYHVKSGEWLDLPAAGVDIAFHGSSAVVSNLHGLSWLRVRAVSCAGESEWSQIEELYGTKASDWEDVPVPEVAEGDQIDPCPVVLGTPVLSNTKTLHHGMVKLDWEDIEDAGWYVVQYYHVKSGEWLDLPAEGVDIAFHGSSAVVSDLHGLSWLRVRAMSCAGESEWSQIEELYGTNSSDWEGVPVPEVAEGDEIEPCSEDADTPPDNSPATGAPTISGTAQVSETLSADKSGIADADGLTNATFSYQWLADDTTIAGATGSTHTLADADVGKTIKVQVSFTDDAGNVETLTSAATAAVAAKPNSPATGAPTIDGTVQVGETLTANTSGVADADGLSNVQYEYQWLADDAEIAGATGSTYTLADSVEGKTVRVQASFTDDAGNDEALTSAPTDAVVAPTQVDSEDEPSLRSYITVVVAEDTSDPDNPQTDFTITWSDIDACSTGYNAYLSSWTYANGRERTHLGSAATDGSRITSSLSNMEGEGIFYGVKLFCGTEDSGRSVSRVSIPRDDGRLVPSTYSSEPPLTALTVSPGTLTPTFHSHTLDYTVTDVVGEDVRLTLVASAKPDYSVVFLKDIIGSFSTCSPWDYFSCSGWQYQDGDHNRVYPLTDADADEPGFQVDLAVGEELAMHVTREYRGAPLENQFYNLTVTHVPNSPAAGQPTISGIPQVGETLTAYTTGIADEDGLDNVAYTYQWLANDSGISGATNATYTPVAADEGKAIKVQVSFADDAGNGETLTSAATDAVAAAPTPNSPATGAPAITGTAQVGETLTADTSGIADEDGLTNATYSFQWLADDAEIAGATSSTYTLADTDEGKSIKVGVTFTDDAGNGETLTSAATDAVAAEPSEPPDQPTGLDATATHDSVTLTWDDPQDESITGYVILRRVRVNNQGGDFSVLVANTGSAATTYTDNEVAASTTYTYRIKAINEHGVSERSRWVHIDTPAPPVPDKPTGLEATMSNGQVVLTWDDPDDDTITGYVILRRLPGVDPEGQFDELVADTGSAATTYTDDTVAASTRYTYRIKAINEYGTSERSRWVHIDTPAAP